MGAGPFELFDDDDCPSSAPSLPFCCATTVARRARSRFLRDLLRSMGSGTHFCLGTWRRGLAPAAAAELVPLLLMLVPVCADAVCCWCRAIWLFQSFSGVMSRAPPGARLVASCGVVEVETAVGADDGVAGVAVDSDFVLLALSVALLLDLRAAAEAEAGDSVAAFAPSVGQSPTLEKSLACARAEREASKKIHLVYKIVVVDRVHALTF